MLHLEAGLVDMSVADNTDIMKSNLKTCPVDFGSSNKKKMYLSTWYLEDSKYGGAGDSSHANKEFGKAVHEMTVKGLCEVIDEFYKTQKLLDKRKPRRKCQKF